MSAPPVAETTPIFFLRKTEHSFSQMGRPTVCFRVLHPLVGTASLPPDS